MPRLVQGRKKIVTKLTDSDTTEHGQLSDQRDKENLSQMLIFFNTCLTTSNEQVQKGSLKDSPFSLGKMQMLIICIHDNIRTIL